MKLRHVLSRQNTEDSLAPPRRHVPWISSPVEKRNYNKVDGDEMQTASTSELARNENTLEFDMRRPSAGDIPIFKKHHEASSIELFYDLFFVANLTTFTGNHEIEDKQSLESYVGFFTLLWFTWLQTSLFDVRFSSDSAYSRVCKALSFGIMTGFAVIGPLFDFAALNEDVRAFRSMTLILMVSRLVLLGQYGVVMWYTRMYKETKRPLAILMATFFLSAVIFLGLFFTFHSENSRPGYIGWYVVIAVEAITVITISSRWRVLSFKHTHLVERVGLLTLIILGEGIIGMTKSVTSIMQGAREIYAADIGILICAVLLVYFLWMLYFDQIENDRFGTIRQQVWAVLHFPLHVAILLTVEGSARFIIWWSAVENANFAYSQFGRTINMANNGTDIIVGFKDDLTAVQNRFKGHLPFPDFSRSFAQLQNISSNPTDAEVETVELLVTDALESVWTWIFQNFGITIPEKEEEHATTSDEKFQFILNIFYTVFLYFFIAAGCTSTRAGGEWVSIFVRVIIGLGLALLSTMFDAKNPTAFNNFLASPWILPTVVLVFGLVILIDNILVWQSNKQINRRLTHEDSNAS